MLGGEQFCFLRQLTHSLNALRITMPVPNGSTRLSPRYANGTAYAEGT